MEVSKRRKQTLSLRWLINYARLRNEKTMELRLANEIIDAYNKTGGSIKKKKIHIKWQMQTEHLLTTGDNYGKKIWLS